MLTQLSRNWWAVALRGVFAILYGAIAFIWPGQTLEVLVLFFGAYMLVDGVFTMIAAFTDRAGHESWWVLVLEGLMGVVAGTITVFRPGLATIVLVYLISFWAIVTGVLEIIAAIQLRKEIQGEDARAWRSIFNRSRGVTVGLPHRWRGNHRLDHRLVCDPLWRNVVKSRLSPAQAWPTPINSFDFSTSLLVVDLTRKITH